MNICFQSYFFSPSSFHKSHSKASFPQGKGGFWFVEQRRVSHAAECWRQYMMTAVVKPRRAITEASTELHWHCITNTQRDKHTSLSSLHFPMETVVWDQSMLSTDPKTLAGNIRKWADKWKKKKVPYFTLFSRLYFPSRTPVEENYLNKWCKQKK